MKNTLALLLIVFGSLAGKAQDVSRIAFGSCSDEMAQQQLWKEVVLQRPQLWIWLGDNIYADSKVNGKLKGTRQELYQRQKANSDYQTLMKTCPVIGVWDDHDYGINDGGKNFAQKRQSKVDLLEFLDVPAADPVWQHEGIYRAYTYGEGEQKLKIILLDTRYFRDTLSLSPIADARYTPNPAGDVLGEEQWIWLEHELTNSDAAIHIIASSIQFISEEHGYEKWANFPAARNRFISLLAKTKPLNTIMLSGDRHIAELSAMTIPGWENPLYDFTSSGLTHTWDIPTAEKNSHRVGNMIYRKNFGMIEWSKKGNRWEVMLSVIGTNAQVHDRHVIRFK